MAQVLNLRLPLPALRLRPSSSSSSLTSISKEPSSSSSSSRILRISHGCNVNDTWVSLQRELSCKPRFFCLFSGSANNKQDQAKKALESALDGKKTEYEKWDKEIKRREDAGGGDGGGGGGGWWWFRWRGWSGDDWKEAQLTCLTILGLFVMYLVVAKGDVIFAVVFNPLLFALRGTRNGLSLVTSRILKIVSPNANFNNNPVVPDDYTRVSAKESVVKKWGSD